MKKLLPLALMLAPTFVFAHDADDSIVHWTRIVGVITAPNVDNPVAGISAGTLPWTTRQGRAHVNLATGGQLRCGRLGPDRWKRDWHARADQQGDRDTGVQPRHDRAGSPQLRRGRAQPAG